MSQVNTSKAITQEVGSDAKSIISDDGLDRLYRVERIGNIAKLNNYVQPWTELSENCAEPNVFYSPWAFQAAAENLSQSVKWEIYLVWRKEKSSSKHEKLAGFFPFVVTRSAGLFGQLKLWQHPYCFYCTPLVEVGHVAQILSAVRETAAHHRYSSVVFNVVAGEGIFQQGLVKSIREDLAVVSVDDQYLRASTPYHAEEGDPLKASMSGHHLRELRRKRRKIEGQGQLEFRVLNDAKQISIWKDWFLELEASGWKANAGTAMALNESDAQFFDQLIRSGFDQNRVRIEGLFLNGQPIAMKIFLLSPPTAFAFKIAFDETLKKQSPGLQLEVESLMAFESQADIRVGDSCAIPGHDMAERVWHDRKIIQNLTISTGRFSGDVLVGMIVALRGWKRALKKLFAR